MEGSVKLVVIDSSTRPQLHSDSLGMGHQDAVDTSQLCCGENSFKSRPRFIITNQNFAFFGTLKFIRDVGESILCLQRISEPRS